jgi:ABC-type sugar transport system ATPase subunit
VICADAFTLRPEPGALALRPGPARLGVRPHDLSIGEPGTGAANARVELVQDLGSTRAVWALLEGGGRICALDSGRALASGTLVGLAFPREHLHLFEPGSGRRIGSDGRARTPVADRPPRAD